MNDHRHQKTIVVPYSRCDFHERLMLSDILRQTQDISMEHCDALGLNNDFFLRTRRLFLLAKVGVKIHRYPRGGESLRILTQPYAPLGAQYQRFTDFYDPDDHLLIRVDSRWILTDMDTHRISRDPGDKELFPFPPGPRPAALKAQPLAPLQQIARLSLPFCMVDRNRHLNNAAYADIVCNCLQEELYAGKQIGELTICYHHEVLFDQRLTLLQARRGEHFYFQGRVDAADCFECNVVLNETEPNSF